jgi:exosortase K
MKRRLWEQVGRYAVTGLVLVAAWLLKRHYSQASAEELRWILAPTTWLTSLLVSGDFEFRPGDGYLSREQSILISPACAGVNFLIVALLSLVLGFSARFGSGRQRLQWLLSSFGLAYVATLLVNALRIWLSVLVAHLAARATGLTFQTIHRLLGVCIYLAGLLCLCLTVQLWLSSRGRSPSNMAPLAWAVGCYAGVTLVVPLAGGAAHNPDYWSHAALVSVVVGGVAALLFAARGRTWDDGRYAVRSPERSERIAAQLDSR